MAATTPSRARIPLSDWLAAGRYMRHRGHRIFLRTAGRADAPVLLLIHGFPTASWDWEALWSPLARRWRVIAPDMIGFGFSDKPRAYDYSLVDQADLCEAVLRDCGAASYHVLAHDYGDSVAQELLARQSPAEAAGRPALRSMCFLNGGLFPETHRPLPIQRLLISPLGPLVGRLTSRAKIAASMRRIFGPATPPDDDLLQGFWSLIAHDHGPRVMHKLIRYMQERRVHRARWVGAMQSTAVPLKLIDGAADPISGAHMAARYSELVPSADVSLLEGIGHYPQVEAPGQVLDAFEAFAANLRADARPAASALDSVPMTNRERFLAYLRAYESMDIARVAALLTDDVSLRDWKIAVRGKAAAVAETKANFDASRSIAIEPLRLYEGEASVAGELRILVDGHIELFVVDVLDFDAMGRITAIRAFLGRGDLPLNRPPA